ncbi:hypothetical protein P3T37_001320 [Kitasatospora sp. MAA4]|uniref:hypothetical protein n=1 Tax=Kitasatospora sp. MAA4 TaxID=3035093 RepID=UPI002476F1D0|nr:hypothetical protein [Kitasatospora sp. MAA4]MDH6131946.1 hypothetical protein [Kitasatospora sp. MAA4]
MSAAVSSESPRRRALVYAETSHDGRLSIYIPNGNRALRRQLVLRQLAAGRLRRRHGGLR